DFGDLDLGGFDLGGFDLGGFDLGGFVVQSTETGDGFSLENWDGFEMPSDLVVQGVFGTGGGGVRLADADKLAWIDSIIDASVTPPPPTPVASDQVVTVLTADFSDETGAASADGFVVQNQAGATVDGLWNLSDRRAGDGGHSANYSFYFGTPEGNYAVGPTAGWLTSPVVDLTDLATAEVSFNYFLNAEVLATSDRASLQVARAGDRFATVLTKADLVVDERSANSWRNATVDLSTYVGDEITLRFAFDTVDDLFNQFEGWYVDDVVVSGRLPLAPEPLTLAEETGAPADTLATTPASATELFPSLGFASNALTEPALWASHSPPQDWLTTDLVVPV
ncbi:MAG: hypothetical protein HC929_17150, partial [Leptolyngbyaceae cyanobacterium SM2_5_2]|nr:hypothetical protein [Leptolyngbyaceae cyanobacterium SM2_5_2]